VITCKFFCLRSTLLGALSACPGAATVFVEGIPADTRPLCYPLLVMVFAPQWHALTAGQSPQPNGFTTRSHGGWRARVDNRPEIKKKKKKISKWQFKIPRGRVRRDQDRIRLFGRQRRLHARSLPMIAPKRPSHALNRRAAPHRFAKLVFSANGQHSQRTALVNARQAYRRVQLSSHLDAQNCRGGSICSVPDIQNVRHRNTSEE